MSPFDLMVWACVVILIGIALGIVGLVVWFLIQLVMALSSGNSNEESEDEVHP